MKKLKPNKRLAALTPPAESDSLSPEPGSLIGKNHLSLASLESLKGASILGVNDFSKEQVIELCKLAAFLESVEIASLSPMHGKIVITAFFEASTRTRTSFESAVLRLDGRIISIPDGQTTGVKKGESLEDIGEMFNAYGDLVIMRHTQTDSLERILKNLRIPLVNAGNGTGEHPTQALADWYSLLKWKPALAEDTPLDCGPLHLGILGTPGSMRAVKSFLLMSLIFRKHLSRITVISEMSDPFGPELSSALKEAGIVHEVTNDIQSNLPQIDVIYMNSITHLGDTYKALDSRWRLTSESPLKASAVILHPLARLEELDTSLDITSHNLYWSQAHGAVYIRQALLMALTGRLDRLPDTFQILKK